MNLVIFLLVFITFLTKNLIYLWLEGTLSSILLFEDLKLLTIGRIVNDVWVEHKIITVTISVE